MNASGCARLRLSLGVYVLGAAEPAERVLVSSHLAWCRACREELAGLAGLPGLLGRVPAVEADTLAADPDTLAADEADSEADPLLASALPRLLGRAARARRARRWLALAAAVAVVLAVAGGMAVQRALSRAGPAVPAPVTWQTAAAHNGLTRASATIRYAAVAWGTELEVQVGGVPAGTACQLRVAGSDPRVVIAGGWVIVPGQPGPWYPAATSLAASRVRGFSVTVGGKALVTVPIRG